MFFSRLKFGYLSDSKWKMDFGHKTIAGFFAIIIVFMGVYAYIYDSKIDLNGDNANYYMLGQALHQGEGYVSINSINKTPNNHFPPGYPAILSMLFFISDSFFAVKILNALFLVGSLLLSFVLIRKISGEMLAWVSIPFLILNAHLLKYSTMMMTEVPFLFFSLLSFWFFLKGHEATGKKSYKEYAVAFIFFLVAFYIRTLGIAILAAYGMVLLFEWRARWKILTAYIFGFILCYLPWMIRGINLGGNSYVKQLIMINPYRPEIGEAGVSDFVLRFASNLGRYISREIPEVLFPFKSFNYKEPVGTFEWIIGVLIFVLIILGITRLKTYRNLIIGYVTATFAVLLIWPDVWVGIRFVLPTLPFLILLFLNGVQGLLEMLAKPLKRSIPIWLSLVLIFPFFEEIYILNLKSKAPYALKWENYFKLAKGLKKEGNTEIVVSCRKPTLFYLFSGTHTTRYKYTLDDKEFLTDLELRKVDLVVLEQLGYGSTYRYLYPAIDKNPTRFQNLVHLENPDTYLLRFKKNQSND